MAIVDPLVLGRIGPLSLGLVVFGQSEDIEVVGDDLAI